MPVVRLLAPLLGVCPAALIAPATESAAAPLEGVRPEDWIATCVVNAEAPAAVV